MPWKRTELRQYKGEGRLAMQRGSLEVVSLIPQAAFPHSMEWEVRSRDLAKGSLQQQLQEEERTEIRGIEAYQAP